MKKQDYFILTVLFIFLGYIIIPLIANNIALTDDIARINEAFELRKVTHISAYIYNFLNTETMSSRPVSGIITSIISYFSGYNEKYYFLGYLFFPISLLFVLKTTYSIFKNYFYAISITFIYCCIPIGTALLFSPLMLNSSLATIFYCISIYLIIEKKNRFYYVLSITFFILSVFSYEIFLPLIVSNIFLLNKRKIKYFLFVIIIILLYRNLIEPQLFSNYHHRSSVNSVFDIKRDLILIFKIIKVLTYDLFYGLYRAFIALKFYSIVDFVMLIFIGLSLFYYLSKNKFESETQKLNFTKINIYVYLSIFLSFIIFFFSNYEPSLKGYGSRTMGAVRFFISIILFIVLLNYKQKIIMYIIIFSFLVSTISVKNAWVYGKDFNEKIFSKLKTKEFSSKECNTLYIVFNKDNIYSNDTFSNKVKNEKNEIFRDKHFIFEEPIFHSPWEPLYYLRKYNLDKKVKILYFFYDDRSKNLPYYLYDLKTNDLQLVK